MLLLPSEMTLPLDEHPTTRQEPQGAASSGIYVALSFSHAKLLPLVQ